LSKEHHKLSQLTQVSLETSCLIHDEMLISVFWSRQRTSRPAYHAEAACSCNR